MQWTYTVKLMTGRDIATWNKYKHRTSFYKTNTPFWKTPATSITCLVQDIIVFHKIM